MDRRQSIDNHPPRAERFIGGMMIFVSGFCLALMIGMLAGGGQ